MTPYLIPVSEYVVYLSGRGAPAGNGLPSGVPPVAVASRPACRRWQWPPGRGAPAGNGLPSGVPPVATASRHIIEVAKTGYSYKIY